MYITETERIAEIIRQGASKKLALVDFIDEQIKEFEASNVFKEMIIGEKYDNNQTDILNKRRTYIDDKGNLVEAKNYNNSKVQYPVIFKLKRQKTGYLLKKKFTIKEKIDADSKQVEDKNYIKEINKFFNNRKHKMLKNTLDQSIIKGICWWYIYVSDDLKLKSKMRYGTEIVPIWEDREHENLSAIIERYYMEDYLPDKTKKLVEKVEYHDLNGVCFFVRNDGKLIPDVEKAEENKDLLIGKDAEGNEIFAYFRINGKLQTWEKIPFIYWKYNSQEMPLVHYIKSLIDELEKLKSAMDDRIIDSVDGVHVVKNYAEEIEKFQKNLNTFKTVFLDTDGEYDFKQGTIDVNAFKEAIEQLRKDIYDIGCGVDTESDKFGNQQSGVALQELFNNLDLDCSNIETEFQSSLEYFMFFFNTFYGLINNKDYSEKEVEYVFNKSMITDDTSKITNLRNSVGIISNETIRSEHPYVTDLIAENKRIQKEKEKEDKESDDYSNLDHKGSDLNEK